MVFFISAVISVVSSSDLLLRWLYLTPSGPLTFSFASDMTRLIFHQLLEALGTHCLEFRYQPTPWLVLSSQCSLCLTVQGIASEKRSPFLSHLWGLGHVHPYIPFDSAFCLTSHCPWRRQNLPRALSAVTVLTNSSHLSFLRWMQPPETAFLHWSSPSWYHFFDSHWGLFFSWPFAIPSWPGFSCPKPSMCLHYTTGADWNALWALSWSMPSRVTCPGQFLLWCDWKASSLYC